MLSGWPREEICLTRSRLIKWEEMIWKKTSDDMISSDFNRIWLLDDIFKEKFHLARKRRNTSLISDVIIFEILDEMNVHIIQFQLNNSFNIVSIKYSRHQILNTNTWDRSGWNSGTKFNEPNSYVFPIFISMLISKRLYNLHLPHNWKEISHQWMLKSTS